MKRFSEVLREYRNRAETNQGQNSHVQAPYDPMPAQYSGNQASGNQAQYFPAQVSQPNQRPAVFWTNGR